MCFGRRGPRFREDFLASRGKSHEVFANFSAERGRWFNVLQAHVECVDRKILQDDGRSNGEHAMPPGDCTISMAPDIAD